MPKPKPTPALVPPPRPAREMAIEHFFIERDRGAATVAEYAARLATEPRQIENADRAFEAGARYGVAVRVLHLLRAAPPDYSRVPMSDVLAEARRAAMHGARWPKQSTSACTNLFATCETAAWAAAVEELESVIACGAPDGVQP